MNEGRSAMRIAGESATDSASRLTDVGRTVELAAMDAASMDAEWEFQPARASIGPGKKEI
eukprot:5497669-Amphidinium_carterae.1